MIARIRTFKPEVFLHEGLFDTEAQTKLPIRLAWIGLFTCCDREGRFQWRPRVLKTMIMPYDDIDFSHVLDALATRGFVVKYTANGDDFGFIPSWKRHQVINNREALSQIPEPTRDSRVDDARSTTLVHTSGEGNGTEGNGTEGGKDFSLPPVNNLEPSQPKSNGNGSSNGRAAAHLSKALANKLGVPITTNNLKAIEAGIENECLVSHCTELEAAEIIAAFSDPSAFGKKGPRFYFEDADWRNNNNYGLGDRAKQ